MKKSFLLLLLTLLLAWPEIAAACATCYGAADHPMTRGMSYALFTLLAVLGVVYAGLGRLFWGIRKRSREADRKEAGEP